MKTLVQRGGIPLTRFAGHEPAVRSATLLSPPAVPVSHFLRLKPGFSLPVLDRSGDGKDERGWGTYQSSILVQWKGASRQTRTVDVKLVRFVYGGRCELLRGRFHVYLAESVAYLYEPSQTANRPLKALATLRRYLRTPFRAGELDEP